MDKYKYHKYKFKYLSLLNQLGGSKNIIYLEGTSTSGKSTISKQLELHGYKHFEMDSYMRKYHNQFDKIYKLMIRDSKKYPKVVFDIGSQSLLQYLDRANVSLVLIYTPLCDMVNNLISRKSQNDPRGLYIFSIFTGMYVKSDINCIDRINRKNFIECLQKISHEFESNDKLIEFAHSIFSKMDINDDADHCIATRKYMDYVDYDFLINTHGKSITEITDEILNKVS